MNEIFKDKLTYKRNFDHNYLVIKGDDELGERIADDYMTRMMIENEIPNFLRLTMKMNEGIYDYYYEISSRQPLSRLYEHREIKNVDLVNIINEIAIAYNNAFEYMLEGNHFILIPEYMYINLESNKIELLYYPEYSSSIENSLMTFAEYVLDRVDHQDSEAVMLAYKFYKVVKEAGFTIRDLKSIVLTSVEEKKSLNVNSEVDYIEKDVDSESYIRNNELENLYEEDMNSSEFLPENLNKGNTGPISTFLGNIFGGTGKKKLKEKELEEYQFQQLPQSYCDQKESIASAVEKSDSEIYGKTVILVPEHTALNHTLTQRVKGKEIVHNLDNLPISIGKVEDMVDIVIKDSSVSRIHAQIFAEKDIVYIKDCNSTNGTFVNGMQLDAEEKISLEEGDEITLGKVTFEYL